MNYSRKQMFCLEVVPVLSWLTYLTVIDRLTVVPGQNRDKKIRKLLKNEKNEVKYQRVRSRRLPSANPSLTAVNRHKMLKISRLWRFIFFFHPKNHPF